MSATQGAVSAYYLPKPSRWPVTGACALLLSAAGAATWINHGSAGPYLIAAGTALLVYMLFGWFGTVIRESEAGLYDMRWHAVPDLASGDTGGLWPGFKGNWPASGPAIEGTLTPMRATGVPLINTLILLASGATLFWAHLGLKKGARGQLKLGLVLTVGLGIVFLYLQASEHYHAYTAMNLKLGSGAYGATFFMLTGFHGLHVFIGATVLIVILARSLRGDFTPGDQFAFQAATWYWQFVDVIWLLMFVLVYWL